MAEQQPTVELIMAEFGAERLTAGDADLPLKNRLNPTLDSFREYFPDATISLYTDCPKMFVGPAFAGVDVKPVTNPIFDRRHSRYGWRCNDYYSVLGLRISEADVAISMDADMAIISDDVRSIVPLTKKFGICLPANGRFMVRCDARAVDGNEKADESRFAGHAYAMSPIAVAKDDDRASAIMTAYLEEMRTDPVRGPLAMWRAAWATGVAPYLLPPQWCVCADQCGIGHEIVLHVGHRKVADFYRKWIVD